MSEQTKPIEMLQSTYICDSCWKGEMIPTNEILLSYPPQYPHVCSSCGARQNFREQYPVLRWKEAKP